MRFLALSGLLPLAAALSAEKRDLCLTGPALCCQNVTPFDSRAISIANILGVTIPPDVRGNVGYTCTPLNSPIYITNPCFDQLVCCTSNDYHGIMAFGCTPYPKN